jgi:UDP-N-acetylmuramoyl-tripeptide--D-alanyl-D-alanine ligase
MIEKLYHHFIACNQQISTDTRKISENSIFFALKGPNFNGNKFAKDALVNGANFVIIDETEYLIDERTILVDNVLKCLQELANYHRRKLRIPVIGITGTNGKTTSKELIGAVLSTKYNTHITSGNLNNHIGVPLTLLKLTTLHEIAIIEMGASKQGDIKELADIAEPTHGLITNIGKAHLEGFGSFENIVKTKLELYDYIHNSNGEIFVNGEDDLLKNKIDSETTFHSYGHKNSIVNGFVAKHHPTVSLKWSISNSEYKTKTNLIGAYNLNNLLCAICIGNYFNVSDDKIHSAIESYTPSNHRSQIVNTKKNTIIADCYNANPSSVMESLKSFKSINKGNKLAILGDMLELGSVSNDEHLKIISYLEKENIDAILVGKEFSRLKSNYPTFKNTNDMIEFLNKKDFKNFTILLKGSRGIKLEKLIDTTIF